MSPYLAAVSERVAPALAELRSCGLPGDLDAIVATTVADYDISGDATLPVVALARRVPQLAQAVEGGGRAHRAWSEHSFALQLKAVRASAVSE